MKAQHARSTMLKIIIVNAIFLFVISGYAQSHQDNEGPLTPPVFTPVFFSGSIGNYGATLYGTGFGTVSGLPANEDLPYFRIGDITCFKKSPGNCEAGFSGDIFTLNYLSWTNNEIQFNEYPVASPGDAFEIGVWNPQYQRGPLAAAWGGNIPPLYAGTPQISNVVITGSGQNLSITIYGSNFGTAAPPGVPCLQGCDTASLRFGDYAYHSFVGGSSVGFRAGFTGDSITLAYALWSNNQIVLSGFAGTYGQDGLVVNANDPVCISIWSTAGTGFLATAWCGRVAGPQF